MAQKLSLDDTDSESGKVIASFAAKTGAFNENDLIPNGLDFITETVKVIFLSKTGDLFSSRISLIKAPENDLTAKLLA